MKLILKLLGFNGGLAAVDIASLTLLWNNRASMSAAIFWASTLTILLVSILLFGVVNFSFLNQKSEGDVTPELEEEEKRTSYELSSRKEYERYVDELRKSPDNCMMRKEIAAAATQAEGFVRKVNALNSLLASHFEGDAYLPVIQNTIDDLDVSIRANIVKILKRLAVNDEQEYMQLKANPANTDAYHQKMAHFQENIEYVRKLVAMNDALLMEFDKLMNEISRINDSNDEDDLSKIADLVDSMERMRMPESDGMEELEQRYGGQ